MARDLVSGRAFPMFMYGQRYLLCVSVWLCAPLFALFGASIVTLKLPMFAMNIAAVVMLWRGLRRELDPVGTTLAVLPFAIPSALVSSRLVEHQGGNIEPFVFVLAAFFLRQRPIWLGVLLGVGFLNREFTLIGLIALLVLDGLQGELLRRWKHHLTTIGTLAIVAGSLRLLANWSTSYYGAQAGPGKPKWENLWGFVGQQLPSLFGALPRKLSEFNVASQLTVGHVAVGYALLLLCAAAAMVLAWKPLERRELNGMSSYLALVGIGQACAFVLVTPSAGDVMLVRYILLVLLGLCGLVALAWRRAVLRPIVVAVIGLLTLSNLTGNLKLVHEYASGPPRRELNTLAEALLERGVHYALADYWTSFDLAWLTEERIIASPERGRGDRMARYSDELDLHRDEVYRISNEPCTGGEAILRWYLCKPPRAHD